jgi:hypothetical protein
VCGASHFAPPPGGASAGQAKQSRRLGLLPPAGGAPLRRWLRFAPLGNLVSNGVRSQ